MSFRRRPEPLTEDPAVAPVEALLTAAAARTTERAPVRDGRIMASHVVWLCACVSMDDAPVWLLYGFGDSGFGWLREPLGTSEVTDAVGADHLTGCHPAPEDVLAWLRGDQAYPWLGRADFREDLFIYDELFRRILPT